MTTTTELTLSTALQDCARRYIAAQQRSGEALLEACAALAEARALAKHGEWGRFLEATRTSEGAAKRLLDIHAEAERDPQFAAAVRSNWIGATVAAELAQPSFPAEARSALLSAPEPPTRADVQSVKSATVADLKPAAPFWQARSANHPTAHVWARERPDLWRSACGQVMQNRGPSGSTEAGHCSSCVRATWPQNADPAATPPIVRDADDPSDEEYNETVRAFAQHGYRLVRPAEYPGRYALFPPDGRPGITNMQWHAVASRLGALERQALEQQTSAPPAPSATVPSDIARRAAQLGLLLDARPEGMILYWPEERDQIGTDRGDSIEPMTPAEARDWLATQAPQMALERLDRLMPKAIFAAGYYWHAADPPTIAHNDGWRGDAPTAEAALELARARMQARPAATAPPAGLRPDFDQPFFVSIKVRDQPAFAAEIADFFKADYGIEWPLIGAMLRDLAARLDVGIEPVAVPTLQSEGISSPLDQVAACLAQVEAWAQRHPDAGREELRINLDDLHEAERLLQDCSDADDIDGEAWERLSHTRGELETLLRERLEHRQAVAV